MFSATRDHVASRASRSRPPRVPVLWGALLLAGLLAGCDKPVQGSAPADAGGTPATGGPSSPEIPASDSAGPDESGTTTRTDGDDPKRELAAGDGKKADGSSCLAASECASGVCEGEGCGEDKPGTCAPTSRMCTRDLREYCGCDGVTFRASGSCAGARFSKREAC
jgi:hypothetical protein